jgi:hypothetical protein
MPDAPDATRTKSTTDNARLWTGSGLCCEAQGDGVPCYGTDGECETCGRALEPADRRDAPAPSATD